MNPAFKIGTLRFSFILVLLSTPFYGNSQNKAKIPSAGTTLKLEYNYPVDRTIKYLNKSKVVQILDIEGQTMQVDANLAFGCTVKSAGKDSSIFTLDIGIDTLAQIVDSPQGSSGGPVSVVRGKTFKMKISPRGKELDYSEAEKVTFTMGASGETNISQFVLDLFPDLPSNPVKQGDQWNSTDTLTNKTASMTMSIIVESVNKFDGIEVVNGIECVRITSDYTGNRHMNTQSQGMDIVTRGPFTGTGILYFAFKEGYFIRQSVKTSLKGIIEISQPQEMSFPLIMETISMTEIVK